MQEMPVVDQKPLEKSGSPEVSDCAAPPSPTYPTPHDSPVVIPYHDLHHGNEQKISGLLEEAFGPGALGLILISGVPGFKELRQSLLHLGYLFMCLDHATKQRLEDPASSYSVGWSYGREQLADGKKDLCKESFYFSLNDGRLLHVPAEVRAACPAYYNPNIWLDAELPGLKPVALEAGCLIREVGVQLARHMDRYVSSRGGGVVTGRSTLEGQLRRSEAHKARLLGYHPCGTSGRDDTHQPVWCTEHLDHGALTGLMPAMYFSRASGMPVPSPDPSAGLYVRRQDGSGVARHVQVSIPPDCIAFQIGEAAQVMSGDLLQATPHYVRAPAGALSGDVMRVTLALFLQPDVTETMDPPTGLVSGVKGWQPGMTFGDFANTRFAEYYPDVGNKPHN